jgi:N-methylhydantoinase B/oxoprolinase/acetone carboxylase alpha subunit
MTAKTEIKKGQLFIKQVVSKLKGDGVEELAAKIARKALSAVDSQLASLRSREVDLENSLDDANELLETAKFPVTMITDSHFYIKGIQRAQEAKDKAEEDLTNVKESIVYFETLLASF